MHQSAFGQLSVLEMSTSRIEIPLTLPPPHFDDEATIATARQVVPIKGAGRMQRRGKVLALFPLLIASTLCGALGAVAVNYFERRNQSSASNTQLTTLPSLATQAKAEPSPVATPPQPSAAEGPVQQPAESTDSATASVAQPTPSSDATNVAKPNDESAKSPPSNGKRETTVEAAKLVRKRRVLSPEPEAPQKNRRNGASRIEDLFGGPNP